MPQPAGGIARYTAVDEGAMMAPGQAMARAGATVEEFGNQFHLRLKHEQEKADTLRAEEAFTKLRQKQLDLTTGEGGFVNQKGANAVTKPILKDYTGQFDMAVQQAASDLQTDEQRALFTRRANVASLEFKGDILKHVVSQGSVYGKEVYDGIVNLETRNVVAKWDDRQYPGAVGLALGRIEAAVNRRAESEGWPKEYADAIKIQDASKIHDAVIRQAIATGDTAYAEKWFKENKDQIAEPTAIALQKVVHDGAQRQIVAGYNEMILAARDDGKALRAIESAILKDKRLTPELMSTLHTRAVSKMDQVDRRSEANYGRWESATNTAISGLSATANAGFEPNANEIAEVYAQTRNTPLASKVDKLINDIGEMRNFRLMKPAEKALAIQDRTAKLRAGGLFSNPDQPRKELLPAVKQYAPIIDVASQASGVSATVLAAQIQVESGGSPTALSPKGAQGVSQFIPDTAKRYGVDVTSPDSSIKGQAAYMKDLLAQFDGDYDKALAAYNMGEGSVERKNGVTGLVMKYGDKWLDNAPAETRKYVASIKALTGDIRSFRGDVQQLERMKSMYKAQTEALKDDPVTYFVSQGIVSADSLAAKPIDFSNPNAVNPVAVKERLATAKAGVAQYGAAYKPLTNDEIGLAMTALKAADDGGKSVIFGTMALASGNDFDGYRAMIAQIAPDAPALAVAGELAGRAAMATDVGVKREPRQAKRVSDLIIAGEALRNPNRKQDGRSQMVTMPPDAAFDKMFDAEAKTAFSDNATTRNMFLETTKSIYAKLTMESGNQDGNGIVSGRFLDAFKMATGGVEKHKGAYITLPWAHTSGEFLDGLQERTKAMEVAGELPPNVTARHLQEMPLVNAGRNKYRILGEMGWMADRRGRPIEIDFDKMPVQQVDARLAGVVEPRNAEVMKRRMGDTKAMARSTP